MDTYRPTEADLDRANTETRIKHLARQVLMQGPALMTQAEAVAEARRLLARGIKDLWR